MSRQRRAQDDERGVAINYALDGLNRVAYEWARTGIELMLGVSNRCGNMLLDSTEVFLSKSSRTDTLPRRKSNQCGLCDEELTTEDREVKGRAERSSTPRRSLQDFASRKRPRRYR